MCKQIIGNLTKLIVLLLNCWFHFYFRNCINFSNRFLNVSLIQSSIYTHVFDCNHWLDFKNVILNSSKYKILLNQLDYYEKHGLFLLLLGTQENIKSLKEFLIKVTLKIFQTGIRFPQFLRNLSFYITALKSLLWSPVRFYNNWWILLHCTCFLNIKKTSNQEVSLITKFDFPSSSLTEITCYKWNVFLFSSLFLIPLVVKSN